MNSPSFQAALQSLGRGDEADALQRLHSLLDSEPSNLEAHFIIGMVASRRGRWRDAADHLNLVFDKQPDRFEALFWLGVAKKNLGEISSATKLFVMARHIAPREPSLLNELGLCLLAEGRAQEALEPFQAAVKGGSNRPELLHNLGLALAKVDRTFEARDQFVRCVEADPLRVENYIQLCMQLEKLGEWAEIVRWLKRGLTKLPDNVPLLNLLAGALSQSLDVENAEKIYCRAAELDASSAQSFGLWLQERGRFEESVRVFTSSIEALPVQGSGYYGLVEAKVSCLGEASILDRMNQVLEASDLDPRERIYLLYAMGKAYEREEDFEAAITAFDRANEAAFRSFNWGRPFDREVLGRITNNRIGRFSKKFLEEVESQPPGSIEPLFVVGMIRSGTTLLDQILSAHSQIASAGEQIFWMSEADQLRRKRDYRVTKDDANQIRSRYLQLVREYSSVERLVIDKMPLNYAYLGLIYQIFPNAKFLHIRRNGLDTCLSIWTTFFGQGPNFAYDQSNIVFNYHEYLRLMDHWRKVLPDSCFFEMDYETLVNDRESVVREVLSFLGLEWEYGCLNHHDRESSIRTPSRWQARQPVYRTSVGRGERYLPWLRELRELA